jgi:predicted HTH transcriptional regulator
LVGVEEVRGGPAILTGVTHHLDDANLQQMVSSKTNKPITFRYEGVTIGGKQVGVFQIPKQERPRFLTKDYGGVRANAPYIRRGSSTDVANPDEVVRMAQEDAPRSSINAEADTLRSLLDRAHFYTRVLQLTEDISHLPDHYIAHIAKPPSYEERRRPLHERFNNDYYDF